MGSGLSWKKDEEQALDRRRRFFRREMQEGILAILPVSTDVEEQRREFRSHWKWV